MLGMVYFFWLFKKEYSAFTQLTRVLILVMSVLKSTFRVSAFVGIVSASVVKGRDSVEGRESILFIVETIWLSCVI